VFVHVQRDAHASFPDCLSLCTAGVSPAELRSESAS
jgi:hypothetical protein